jgi:cytochrome c
MTMLRPASVFSSVLTAALLLTVASQAQAVDADAAQALAKRNNCFKCHAIDKKKDAIAWKDVPAKLKKEKVADPQAFLIKHITTGPTVKLDDGSEEKHPIIKTKDEAEIKNLVDWILSL